MDKTYISLKDIKKHSDEIRGSFAPLHRLVLDAFVYSLESIPPAKVEPVKEAKWIPVSTKPGVYAGMKCSLCKAKISYRDFYSGNHNYCHKCGAKMIKED